MTEMTKLIWMYWAQGWDKAPDLVQKCKRSWERLNPEYRVMALDDGSLGNYINLPPEITVDRPDLPIQPISDLIRIGVLAKHGGVWADATLMCAKPLRDWLPEYYSTAFFAFRNPGVDRLFSSWFMACEPKNRLAETLYAEYSTFLSSTAFTNQNNFRGKILRSIFRKKWNKNIASTINWHSDYARNVLKTYPYYIFHYTFNKIILEDKACRDIWQNAKPFEADLPHNLQHWSRQRASTQKAVEFIASGQSPVHKLNWRRNTGSDYWTQVLNAFN